MNIIIQHTDTLAHIGLAAYLRQRGYLHSMNQGKVIRIEMSGNRTTDFTRANAEIGLSSKPANYTWHHLDDFEVVNGKVYCTMQLVQSSAHGGSGISGMAHTGSVAQWKAYFGSGY